MLKRLATALWGEFDSVDEVKKFGLLGTIFFLIIGVYWALRPIKDSIFGSVVGTEPYLAWAKILSVFITIPLVLIYGKLVDTFPRRQVFYGIVTTYACLALLFSWGFLHPEIGLSNTITGPHRIIGWAFYVWVESFGSLIVSLFWTITTDSTLPESAKRGFPIIALGGQLGNVVGPFILNARFLTLNNSAPILGVCAILMLVIVGLFYLFMHIVPQSLLTGYHQGEPAHDGGEAGFFEGLKLLFTHKYLGGLFLVVGINELIVTIFDNHFKISVNAMFPTEALRAAYLSDYAVCTGLIATVCVLLGINNIQRYLGIVTSLIITPVLVAVAAVWLKFNPHSLTSCFWIMAGSKAVNYAFNAPTMKQLYIPTSKDAKYKSQSWIEMFGSRAAKGSASGVNIFRKSFVAKFGPLAGVDAFLTMTTLMSFGFIGAWLLVVVFVAGKYNKAIKEKTIVC